MRTEPFGTSPRRWLVAGGIAAVGVAAAATAVAGGFNGFVGAPTPTSTVTSQPSPSATPTIAPATLEPTLPPTASPRPRRTPASTPAPQTYVVQEGDTLSTIAAQFGTSVSAIQRANGLGSSDVINVGQVLVIP